MRIVMCCTGNTCRSPMAERILISELNKRGANGFTVTSCGVMCGNGMEIAQNSRKALTAMGIDADNHKSRCINREIIDNSDLIITMTAAHKAVLIRLFGENPKFTTIGELVGNNIDINDPFGNDERCYQLCAEIIRDMIVDIIDSGKLGKI